MKFSNLVFDYSFIIEAMSFILYFTLRASRTRYSELAIYYHSR